MRRSANNRKNMANVKIIELYIFVLHLTLIFAIDVRCAKREIFKYFVITKKWSSRLVNSLAKDQYHHWKERVAHPSHFVNKLGSEGRYEEEEGMRVGGRQFV